MPGILVASRLSLDPRAALIDCQVEGDHTVAAHGVMLHIGGG